MLRNLYELTCDGNGCGNQETFGPFDVEDSQWTAFLEAAKEEGWRHRKQADEWTHYCPSCRY
jgi:hypothetical protein